MSGLGSVLLLNALAATFFALAAAALARVVRRPALVHGLWLLVLIKLFTPPLLEVAVLPGAGSTVARPQARSVPLEVVATLGPTGGTDHPVRKSLPVGVALWVVGGGAVLLLTVLRARRFGVVLREARAAAPALRDRASHLATAMGLASVPEIRVVPARISPMLWHRPGRLSLLLPESLLSHLDAGECDALLAHELAHVRRRDHWVRYLELLATTVFWWHPAVWWSRRALRRAEEQCCDLWVLRTLGEHPRVYARALLKTVEFLAGGRVATPALACGAGSTGALKERLTMIMKRREPTPPSATRLAAAGLVATAALLLFPTWAEHEETGESETDVHEAMTALERQAVELEERLLEVRTRQSDLERSFVERRGQQELDRLRLDAERAAAEGRVEEARAGAEAARQLARQIEVERSQRDLEREVREIEAPLRRMHLEIADAEASGAPERAEEIRRRAEELEAALIERAAEMERSQLELAQEMATEQVRALSEELDRARSAADADRAAEIERELRLAETERQRAERRPAEAEPRDLAVAEMQDQVRMLAEQIRRLEERLEETARRRD